MSDFSFPFKTLAEAKEHFITLSETAASLTSRVAEFDALSALNVDLTAQLSALVAEKTELESKFAALNTESVASISAKEAELVSLQSEKAALETQISSLTKNQKSVKAQARELVAASAAPAPASVDATEVELEGKDLVKAMRDEKDPDKLYALYQTYKKQLSVK